GEPELELRGGRTHRRPEDPRAPRATDAQLPGHPAALPGGPHALRRGRGRAHAAGKQQRLLSGRPDELDGLASRPAPPRSPRLRPRPRGDPTPASRPPASPLLPGTPDPRLRGQGPRLVPTGRPRGDGRRLVEPPHPLPRAPPLRRRDGRGGCRRPPGVGRHGSRPPERAPRGDALRPPRPPPRAPVGAASRHGVGVVRRSAAGDAARRRGLRPGGPVARRPAPPAPPTA